MNASWLPILQSVTVPIALPVWVAGALAALLLVMLVVVLRRAGGGGRYVTLFGVALLAAAVVAVYIERSASLERAAERRALEARSAELTARALAPGSALACLDGRTGETVENACEKAIFARPENAAAAVAYMTARIGLLADTLEFAKPGDAEFAAKSDGLRRAIELDRYGVAAHVLAMRYACTAESCPVFALLKETDVLKANLRTGAFETYVERHAVAWNEPDPPAEKPAAPAVSSAPPAQTLARKPVGSQYDFPSADSIPAVSIMNTEPPRPAPAAEGEVPAAAGVAPAAAEAPPAAAAANAAAPPANTPVPPPRPQNRAAGSPAR